VQMVTPVPKSWSQIVVNKNKPELCAVLLLACVAAAAVQIPSELLNEWSQFKADDEFYNQVDSFLQTETATGQAGGDFQFKCETTCQLVQKNPAAAAASLLQTGEGSNDVEESFHKNMASFLETETNQAGGDFEFKCETTCQLVQTNTPAGTPSASARTNAANAASTSLLQTEEGVSMKATAQAQQAKDCYRLCLNPSMNPGCDAATQTVSLLETGVMTEEEMMRKNWSLGSGSGNCLNSCVHVCMAVHESVSAKQQ